MDFKNRLILVLELLPFCLIAGIVGTAVFFIIGVRKRGKANNIKTHLLRELLAPFFAFSYLALVLGIMFANGSNMREFSFVLPFAQYYEAIKNGSLYLLTNVLLNVTVFIPLGFFAALLVSKFRSSRVIFSVTLLLTTIIEILQLFTGKAAFSCDDIIGGIIGALLGYGIFGVIKSMLEKYRGNKEGKAGNHWFYLTLTAVGLFFLCSYLYCGFNPATAETYYGRIKKVYDENKTKLMEYADRGSFESLPDIEPVIDMIHNEDSFQLIFEREFNGRDLRYYGLMYSEYMPTEGESSESADINDSDIISHNGFYLYQNGKTDYEIKNIENNFFYFMIKY